MTGRAHAHTEFTAFVREVEPRLSFALAAAYGPEIGREATADALAFGWENWSRVQVMDNPAGYLFRVGQTAAKRHRRSAPLFPHIDTVETPEVEPRLPGALASLSRSQRVAVVLMHGMGWSEREVAELLGVHRSTVRRHRERGLKKLRRELEVDHIE